MSSVVGGNHSKNISQKYCELSCQLYGLSGFAGWWDLSTITKMADQENEYNQQAESKKIGNEKIITLASISTYKIMPIGMILAVCYRSRENWF